MLDTVPFGGMGNVIFGGNVKLKGGQVPLKGKLGILDGAAQVEDAVEDQEVMLNGILDEEELETTLDEEELETTLDEELELDATLDELELNADKLQVEVGEREAELELQTGAVMFPARVALRYPQTVVTSASKASRSSVVQSEASRQGPRTVEIAPVFAQWQDMF
jgi:hypothetical protein